MLPISQTVSIPLEEIDITAIRAQGAGGQNVNKVATAIHLRFDILNSSLPDYYKQRLMHLNDYRINKEGIINIKAQRFRTQLKNKEDALSRLQSLIQSVNKPKKKRIPTKPSKASQKKRVEKKIQRGKIKKLRQKKPNTDD